MNKILIAIIALSIVAACAVPVTREAMEAASFGPEPLREEYMAIIEGHIRGIALDPESIILNCFDATKGWARRNVSDQPAFGWLVACDVNGRNRFGGYTGNQPYVFLFNDGGTLVLDSRQLEASIQQKIGVIAN